MDFVLFWENISGGERTGSTYVARYVFQSSSGLLTVLRTYALPRRKSQTHSDNIHNVRTVTAMDDRKQNRLQARPQAGLDVEA